LESQHPRKEAFLFTCSRYRKTRYWAVWQGETLIAVTVYKRGALSVVRHLAAVPEPAVRRRNTAKRAMPEERQSLPSDLAP
jgi:hypothetical protein